MHFAAAKAHARNDRIWTELLGQTSTVVPLQPPVLGIRIEEEEIVKGESSAQNTDAMERINPFETKNSENY